MPHPELSIAARFSRLPNVKRGHIGETLSFRRLWRRSCVVVVVCFPRTCAFGCGWSWRWVRSKDAGLSDKAEFRTGTNRLRAVRRSELDSLAAGLVNSKLPERPLKGGVPPPMNKNKDEIIFGARRAGVTWLYSFPGCYALDDARSSGKRLGFQRLRQYLCGASTREIPENGPRKFTHEDRESCALKIQITECDDFTRRALERQAVYRGCSVEEYIIDGVLCLLASNEETAFFSPETGEVIADIGDFGAFIGCKVDENAQRPPPSSFTQIPVPRRAIIETCT
jgi:hypothetical protein